MEESRPQGGDKHIQLFERATGNDLLWELAALQIDAD